MFKKCRKGFTLIEVIISMAIMSMVMLTVYSLFFSNYKTMNTVNSGVELQSQGQEAMKYLVEAALSANKVNYIKAENGSVITEFNNSNNIKISEISFTTVKINKATNTLVDDHTVKFNLQVDSGNEISSTEGLYKMYKVEKDEEDKDKSVIIASSISSIEVKPFAKNASGLIKIEDINGLEFIVTLKKWKSGKTGRLEDLMIKTVINKVNFRN